MQHHSQESILIDLRWALEELVHDEILAPSDAKSITSKPRPKNQEKWHPFQIIAHQKVPNLQLSGKVLSLDYMTDWLGLKAQRPIYHIDPLKIDVTSVTRIMSFKFAELHHIMAVRVTMDEVRFVTAQPFYHEWASGLSQVIRGKTFTTLVANPEDIYKYRI